VEITAPRLADDGGHGGGESFGSFVTNFFISTTDYICHTCVFYRGIVIIQKLYFVLEIITE
jgi:hypothetical protein